MAIDSVVIRFTPFDPLETVSTIGITTRYIGVDLDTPYGLQPTAYYPGRAASTTTIGTYTDRGRWVVATAIESWNGNPFAGQAAVFEWAFVPIGVDGVTVEPVGVDTPEIHVVYKQQYAGGVVEIGAYIDGVLVIIGVGTIAGFNLETFEGADSGVITIQLAFPEVVTPPFWTRRVNTVEVVSIN